MSSKPCAKCGAPKKPGHPLYCWECWLPRQPLQQQLAECRASRARAELGGHLVDRVPASLWPRGRRWCAGCQRFRRLDVFASGAARCKPCAWEQAHEGMVARTYGMGPGDYDRMLRDQDGRCAICRSEQRMRSLAVHHNHGTGDVVALLCKSCNHDLLGGAWDSPELLLRAWAVQVGGWPLAKAVIETGHCKDADGVPLGWRHRLELLAEQLADDEPESVPY